MELKFLFEPESVAVIGASANPTKIGYSVLSNLLEAGFTGNIHPVNPKADEILGLPVTANISDLAGPLDLAVICVPPKVVLPVLRELVEVPTRAAVVITAGFKEVGREGYFLEREMVELADKHGLALLGPNCLGLINTGSKLNASFAAGYPIPGNIAFFSQSGALCVASLDWALGENIGFSKFVSLGNKAVLDESHMLDYLGKDPSTNVILGYVESVEKGREFVKKAQGVTPDKPVIMIKAGSTAAGAKAASSHTGAIAGSESAYRAAFKKGGIIQVGDMGTLFNLAQAFSSQPLPKGPNLAIVTNSGGPGILAADATEKSRLLMAVISSSTVEKLKQFLPPYASVYNPIDIIGDADAERYRKTMEVVLADPMVHAVLVLMTPTAQVQVEKTAQHLIDLTRDSDKPIFVCFMGQKRIAEGKRMLVHAGIPCFSYPEPAILCLEYMHSYGEWKHRPLPVQVCYRRDKPKAEKVIEEARAKGFTEIVEFQAQGILNAYELPVPETRLARTSDEAVKIAKKIGYPVVLKIASPNISHKSDVGGVVTGLDKPEEVRKTFIEITNRAQRIYKNAFISGCLVQAQAPKGSKEVIIGFKRDPQFGPLILFGLGGIYVEVLKDVAFRLAPLSLNDAHEMIREIKSFPLLRGMRGEAAVDFKAIEDILLTMSQFAIDFPEVAEAEFNPVLVSEKGAMVADVRVTLSD